LLLYTALTLDQGRCYCAVSVTSIPFARPGSAYSMRAPCADHQQSC
jgi:hypothetical protein